MATAVRSAGLTIDRFNREVRINGERVRFTYREFELLCYLAALPGRPVSRAELVREVWHDRAPGGEVSLRTVDTHVRRLRAKLGPHARVLTTIRGRGYRFIPAPTSSIWPQASAPAAPELYRVAVSGPIGTQRTPCGGLPVLAHPLPVETYVPPGRYGW